MFASFFTRHPHSHGIGAFLKRGGPSHGTDQSKGLSWTVYSLAERHS